MAERPNICQLCGTRTKFVAVCYNCEPLAELWLGVAGPDEGGAIYDADGIKRLNPTCYLCGDAPSEHADHVNPRSKGGSNHWLNIGAACAKCNLSKHDMEGITPEQQARLDAQHQVIRDAYARLTKDAWLDILAEEVAEFVDIMGDAAYDFTFEDLLEDLNTYIDERELSTDRGGAEHVAKWLISYQARVG